MSESSPQRLATICVTTFQRPVGLARLLGAIAQLEIPEGWDFDVVVVDNDASGSARSIVEAVTTLDVRYVVEPERGLAPVRNHTLREAAPSAFAAFLDDDEWPEPTWWRRLIEVQTRTGADVVIGPSEPVFEREPPAWIREGRFFEPERFPTGTEIPFWRARTSGVLIRRACFEHLGDEPFDLRNPLHGGEDVRFFRDVQEHGATIVWVDDAIVNEFVPTTRSNTKWLLRRAFRTGNSRSVMLLLERPSLARRAKRIVRGVGEIGIGFFRLVAGRTKADRMKAVAHTALGLGLAVGAVGVRYDEYVVTHGT